MKYIELFHIDSQKKYYQKLIDSPTKKKKNTLLFLNIIKFHQ